MLENVPTLPSTARFRRYQDEGLDSGSTDNENGKGIRPHSDTHNKLRLVLLFLGMGPDFVFLSHAGCAAALSLTTRHMWTGLPMGKWCVKARGDSSGDKSLRGERHGARRQQGPPSLRTAKEHSKVVMIPVRGNRPNSQAIRFDIRGSCRAMEGVTAGQ
jgi:hypothetical protein